MLFRETKREEKTPNNVPIKEKSTSPSEPIQKPKMTMLQHTITGNDVVIPNMRYDNTTLKTIVKERATKQKDTLTYFKQRLLKVIILTKIRERGKIRIAVLISYCCSGN